MFKAYIIILHDLARHKYPVSFRFRGTQVLQIISSEAEFQEFHNLTTFLATTNSIRDPLKESLVVIPGYEDILADIVNICVQMFENKMYLGPTEKNMLVKVIELLHVKTNNLGFLSGPPLTDFGFKKTNCQNFGFEEEVGLYNLSSENKGAILHS